MTNPTLTAEQRLAKILGQKNEAAKRFWAKKTPEEKKAHYEKYKDSYKAGAKRYKEKNPYKGQAAAHQHSVLRRYPSQSEGTDITNSYLEELLKEGGSCPFCGKEARSIDHILPLRRGGLHRKFNIRLLCNRCNLMKGDLLDEEFMDHIKQIHAVYQKGVTDRVVNWT